MIQRRVPRDVTSMTSNSVLPRDRYGKAAYWTRRPGLLLSPDFGMRPNVLPLVEGGLRCESRIRHCMDVRREFASIRYGNRTAATARRQGPERGRCGLFHRPAI